MVKHCQELFVKKLDGEDISEKIDAFVPGQEISFGGGFHNIANQDQTIIINFLR